MSAASTSKSIDFNGDVAIVTGAAGSIGFAIAAALVQRGASVLLNDSGASVQGEGTDATRVDRAVEDIRATGGLAVANSLAVGTPQAAREIVDHATRTFGKVDILVNAAGVARPCPFDAATDEHLQQELQTNLLGPYAMMRAVWPGMRARGYGRILNVSSNAALGIGNNASYATAKAGLLGLTLDAAAEGRSQGILVNALMPVAYSRMIEGIPDPAFVAWFREHMPAEKVAAASLYFLSRSSSSTGQIVSSGGGRLARLVFATNQGFVGATDPETVETHLGKALSITQIEAVGSSAAELAAYAKTFPFSGGSPELHEDAVVGAGKADRSTNRVR